MALATRRRLRPRSNRRVRLVGLGVRDGPPASVRRPDGTGPGDCQPDRGPGSSPKPVPDWQTAGAGRGVARAA